MSLKYLDMEAVLRRLADRRIDEAMQQGKFDNLPGAGKPIDLEPMPAEEGARLMWWTLRILRNNDIVPDEVRWRKAIDLLKAQLHKARDEGRVTELVSQINELVYRINTMGTNVLPSAVVMVELEAELARLRERCIS